MKFLPEDRPLTPKQIARRDKLVRQRNINETARRVQPKSWFTDYIDMHPEQDIPAPIGYVDPWLRQVLDKDYPGWTQKDVDEVRRLIARELRNRQEQVRNMDKSTPVD